jgi:hypothetical protein
MSKQFISEAQRMQKLAGMPISEMALPEMARTADTGGAYTITDKGEEILKQAKASGAVPEGIKASELAVLVFLFKAKKDGKRVQKMNYGLEKYLKGKGQTPEDFEKLEPEEKNRIKGTLQPAVNPLFNSLEGKGLVAKEGYTSKQQEPATSRPRTDIASLGLADLDIEEGQKKP